MKTTKIDWFKPSEKMPKKGTERVLALNVCGYMLDISYDDKRQLFNCHKGGDSETNVNDDIKYWAYISQIRKLKESEAEE